MNTATGSALETAISTLPKTLQPSVELWRKRLLQAHPGAATQLVTQKAADALARLVASSEFAGNVVIREWDWLLSQLRDGGFDSPSAFAATGDFPALQGPVNEDEFKAVLRQVRDRELLHILWRELNCGAELQQTLHSLSELADCLINKAAQHASSALERRFGRVTGDSGRPVPLVILAMGKLGGRELNFSSDVDLIFLHPENGTSDGDRELAAHQYFTRLSRLIVGFLDEVTEDGFVYRVDTRLRPFGDSGPPVVSFAALESYLLQHGRGWERYAYVKARVVGALPDESVSDELMQQMITPFVYRRYLDYGVFESLRDMQALINAEVQKREMATNIKLGPGGIREIEFIVQSLQLVRGGADRELQTPEMSKVLPQLVSSRALSVSAAKELAEAYSFLRRLENFIQAIRDRQTHDLPTNPEDQARVAFAMDISSWEVLQQQLATHRERVAGHFRQVAFRSESNSQSDSTRVLLPLWSAFSGAEDWQTALQQLGYEEADELARILVDFSESRALHQIDSVAAKRVAKFVPELVLQLRHRAAPSRTLQRVLNVISKIVRRSAYVALLNENPGVLHRLVSLCENSVYLAEEVGRFPILLDEMLDPRLYSAEFAAEDMRADLDQRFSSLADDDIESQVEALAQFQRATLFRIAIADFSGSLPIMKVSDRLTELAEIVLQRALEMAWADVTARHGEPWFTAVAERRKAGFGVIAYGKLGGMELSYRSDLDLVFLHDSRGDEQQTDGGKPLENSMFFGRIVRRLVHFLTTQTGSGAMYEVDTRLRPSGRSACW